MNFPPQTILTKFSPYTHFPGFLSPEECQKITSQMAKLDEARVDSSGTKDKLIRNSDLCALEMTPDNQWIFQRLSEAITQCNFDIYGFEIYGFFEAINLIRYEVGDFYDWHQDFGNHSLSQRKLSVVIQLTNPDKYEGGELEFFRNGIAPKDQGTMILFPSFMHHRVTKVTKGTRRSMVGWVRGNPFR